MHERGVEFALHLVRFRVSGHVFLGYFLAAIRAFLLHSCVLRFDVYTARFVSFEFGDGAFVHRARVPAVSGAPGSAESFLFHIAVNLVGKSPPFGVGKVGRRQIVDGLAVFQILVVPGGLKVIRLFVRGDEVDAAGVELGICAGGILGHSPAFRSEALQGAPRSIAAAVGEVFAVILCRQELLPTSGAFRLVRNGLDGEVLRAALHPGGGVGIAVGPHQPVDR